MLLVCTIVILAVSFMVYRRNGMHDNAFHVSFLASKCEENNTKLLHIHLKLGLLSALTGALLSGVERRIEIKVCCTVLGCITCC